MQTKTLVYDVNGLSCHGYLAAPSGADNQRPAVMVVHDWSGCNDFAKQKAAALAELGYWAFAIDLYGEGQLGTTLEEKQALMKPLIDDRALLLTRLQAAQSCLSQATGVKEANMVIIGFCFGGLCALDLARSGAAIAGAVSFHGLLMPSGLAEQPIKAKCLILHGYQDPMVPLSQVESFCQEMTRSQADWQLHMYGHTQHAFTNPQAQDKALGTVYNETMANRAWQTLENFLQELFH